MHKPLEHYLEIVDRVASLSQDRNAQVGCVIVDANGRVLSTGYNDLPPNVIDNDARRTRPGKYVYTEHAERSAIYNAAKAGTALDNTTMYQRWFPCAECARAMVMSGIRVLYCEKPNWDDPRWGESFKDACCILMESNVTIKFYTTAPGNPHPAVVP